MTPPIGGMLKALVGTTKATRGDKGAGGPGPRSRSGAGAEDSSAGLLGDHRLGELLELAGVGVEVPDAVGELVDGHRVLVVLPAVGLLVEVDLGPRAGLGPLDREPRGDLALGLAELLQDVGADGQEV